MRSIRLIFLLIILCTSVTSTPLVMRGVVAEVRDGRTIVVDSHGRKLHVLLRGVDAPDLKQEFGDRSRDHLARLILNKPVEVEFSQFKGEHVIGKVVCEGLDIGLQVVRDGVAWMDRNMAELSAADASVYRASEEAARNEMRGLWQDGTPMPPWEWRRMEAAKATPQAAYKSGAARTLDKEDLLFTSQPTPTGDAALTGSTSLPKPTAKPFNLPGQYADFRPYLNAGRVTIVYFYADWCPACQRLTPVMERVNAAVPDMQVVFMDISEWSSPVTEQFGITSVPHLKIYDKTGTLVAQGREARAWLESAFSR